MRRYFFRKSSARVTSPTQTVDATLTSLPAGRDEARLLYSMGWETANMHLGTPKAVRSDLARRKGRWLHKSAKSMCKITLKDWDDWRRGWKKLAKS